MYVHLFEDLDGKEESIVINEGRNQQLFMIFKCALGFLTDSYNCFFIYLKKLKDLRNVDCIDLEEFFNKFFDLRIILGITYMCELDLDVSVESITC
jgi:hypothetical protein